LDTGSRTGHLVAPPLLLVAGVRGAPAAILRLCLPLRIKRHRRHVLPGLDAGHNIACAPEEWVLPHKHAPRCLVHMHANTASHVSLTPPHLHVQALSYGHGLGRSDAEGGRRHLHTLQYRGHTLVQQRQNGAPSSSSTKSKEHTNSRTERPQASGESTVLTQVSGEQRRL